MNKLILVSIAAVATVVAVATPGHAQNAPWCSQRIGESRAVNCGFYTRDQCMATMSGIGGYCYENYRLAPAGQISSVVPSRKHRRYRRY